MEHGIWNGIKMYVVELLQHSIYFTSKESKYPFTLHHRQLSVCPAFAMAMHRRQRQTLNHVGAYLKQNVFTHDQLYFVLSRVTDSANLYVVVPLCSSSSPSDPSANNMVYLDILVFNPALDANEVRLRTLVNFDMDDDNVTPKLRSIVYCPVCNISRHAAADFSSDSLASASDNNPLLTTSRLWTFV
ncbi:hypothetical protein BC941DRAFT_511795 [Chlamydoabsidia padenii]|nr:hypothetical protein BC941DRAFT_511795 [Chlamydoabsidia padenii]